MKNNNKKINNEIWSFRWCRDHGHVRVGPTLIIPYQQHKTEFLCSQISRHLLKNIASLIRLQRMHHTLTNLHSLVRQFLPIGPQHHSRHLRPCHPWFPHRSARHRTGIRSNPPNRTRASQLNPAQKERATTWHNRTNAARSAMELLEFFLRYLD